MAARGLVARLPDPSDRRGVQVRLTATGRLSVDAALDQLLMRERDLLQGLPQEEQRRLADMLRVLVLPFDDA
jgi:DNA-binding MarR family transcriptional regulator